MVVVEQTKPLGLPEGFEEHGTLLKLGKDVDSRFAPGFAILWAIDQGIEARQYIVLNDSCRKPHSANSQ